MTGQVDLQGRIRVPADLDAVTAVGDEDHSEIDPAAVERIWQAARHWYAAGMHPAIQLCLRHNGKVVLNRAIGHGWGNAPTDPPDAEKIPVKTDTPFCVYSSAKAITATVVHMLVERGQFSLDDRVCEYLPTYTSHGKDRTTIRHVMTHSAGVPFPTGPRAGPQTGGRPRVRAGTARQAAAAVSARPGAHLPRADLGPADARDRLCRHRQGHPRDPGHRDPRPAGLPLDQLRCGRSRISRWSRPATPPASSYRPRSRPRSARRSAARCTRSSRSPTHRCFSPPSSRRRTPSRHADEMSRFAEIWRRGGELDGVQVMRPETLRGAVRQSRRLRPDFATGLAPARWGTGFQLGTDRFGPFGRNAPAAFGHLGLVNIAIWADPERQLAAGVVSSGKPGRDQNSSVTGRMTASAVQCDRLGIRLPTPAGHRGWHRRVSLSPCCHL